MMDTEKEPKRPFDVQDLAIYDPLAIMGRMAYIDVVWQYGVLPQVGVNGAFVEDVIQVAIQRLRQLNQEPYNCRENSLAITALEEAQNWLVRRRLNRMQAGTHGTTRP